jgi:hypothetical protein
MWTFADSITGCFRVVYRALVFFGVITVLASCSAIQGYPHDPGNTRAVLKSLQPYFSASSEDAYLKEQDPTKRRTLRDVIVLSRVHAYDIEFDSFEKSLFTSGSGLSTGSDLTVLVLNGLGATIGGVTTKAALSAASAGIIGAQASINKDLFFQKTIPALLAQIEANRAKVELTIFAGLTQEDGKYPLLRADLDLEALKKAGGIPRAITDITQQAANATDAAQAKIQALRSLQISTSTSSQRIRNWLYPDGKEKDAQGKFVDPIKANYEALQQWMNSDTTDPTLKSIPVEVFIEGGDAGLEADRLRALVDQKLKIP